MLNIIELDEILKKLENHKEETKGCRLVLGKVEYYLEDYTDIAIEAVKDLVFVTEKFNE